jgi:hypothetical protein
MPYPYFHVTKGGSETVSVFLPDGAPVVATGEHPQFAAILAAAASDASSAEEIRDLADLSAAVARHFDQLSERVAVANGRVYFDGDEVDSTITQQIVRCLDDSTEGDWKPLVLFMENVAANPNPHSREQLFDWLRDRKFTIASNGCFIGYKGVHERPDADDGLPYQSASSGEAIVNGERFEGKIPNAPGATVEMPRSAVQHNPSEGCSTGLHVGTYAYAQTYARAALLSVLVNPRDVVSVPTDCNAEKMRVCRYVVQDDAATAPEDSPAIAPTAPRRIYELDDTFYARTGETRLAQKGEHYLYENRDVSRAVVDHYDSLGASPILEPTEPRHGDELVADDDSVQFWLDCGSVAAEDGPDWIDAYGKTQAEFLTTHANCG